MRSGRSSFRGLSKYRGRAPRGPGARRSISGGLVALALSITATLAAGEALPPPPDDAVPGSAATPVPGEPHRRTCPRCGYLCDPGWRYCAACGWGLAVLTGEEEHERLQAIARGSVGLTIGAGRNFVQGTAFAFGGAGLLLTTARILVGADDSSIRVRTYNNREIAASIVGYDLPSGVGVLRTDAPPAVPLDAAPGPLSPADSAWAVCYPVALEDDLVRYLPVSLHRGHVTATGQTGTLLVSLENLLRTDHAIETGCAGGPLVDAGGRIAGMVLGGPEPGITYALPLDGVKPIVDVLLRHERPERPFFGVGLVTLDARRRSRFAIEDEAEHPLIAYLIAGSPAAEAGVRTGDLLLEIDGHDVRTVREAGSRLLDMTLAAPGAELKLRRRLEEVRVTVRPRKRPEVVLLNPSDEIQENLELNLTEVTSGPSSQRGLLVSDVARGGRGEAEHFRSGDLISEVEGRPVETFEAFDAILRTKFRKTFEATTSLGRLSSSYLVYLEMRSASQERFKRIYLSQFPDHLAPPVY